MVQIQLKNPGKIFSVNSELSYFNMAICNSNTQWPRGNTLIPKARDRAKKEEKEETGSPSFSVICASVYLCVYYT